MLKNAYDNDGTILKTADMDRLLIKCGKKVYSGSGVKEKVEIEYAFGLLLDGKYIKEIVDNPTNYLKITKKGLDYITGKKRPVSELTYEIVDEWEDKK